MKTSCKDRIHFLNTGHSDCILLESDGHFALVDSGEDTEYPADKPKLNMPGYENIIIDYLLKHCADDKGIVTLDFILGTHAHSDHIGGFDSIILHPQIRIKQAYLRQYHAETVFILERLRWDNQEVYNQMIAALKKTNTPLCQDFRDKKIKLGNFNITFMHGINRKYFAVRYGENINSVVMFIEKNGTKVLLAADMNHRRNDERVVARRVGKIDLLKIGHHGYPGSNGITYLKKIQPRYAVVTNFKKNVHPHIILQLKHISHSEIYTTADNNGIIADVNDKGNIIMHTNIM